MGIIGLIFLRFVYGFCELPCFGINRQSRSRNKTTTGKGQSVEFLRFLFFSPRFFRENVIVVSAVFATFSRSKMLFGLRDLPLLRPQLHGLPQPGGGHEGVRRPDGEPKSRFLEDNRFPVERLHKFEIKILKAAAAPTPGSGTRSSRQCSGTKTATTG